MMCTPKVGQKTFGVHAILAFIAQTFARPRAKNGERARKRPLQREGNGNGAVLFLLHNDYLWGD